MMENKINNEETMTMIHQIKHRINQNFQQVVELNQSLSGNMRLESNAQEGVEIYPSQQLHDNLNIESNVSALQHSPVTQVASNLAVTPSAGWPPSARSGVQTTSNTMPTLNLPEATAMNDQYSRMYNLLHENMVDTNVHILQMIINLLTLIMDDLLFLFRTLSFSSSSNTYNPNNISNTLRHENKTDLELQQMMQMTNNLLQHILEQINKLLIPLSGIAATAKCNGSYKYLNYNQGPNQIGQGDENRTAIQPSVSIIQNPFAPNNNNNNINNDARTLQLGSSSILTQPTSPQGNTSQHQLSLIGVNKDEYQIMTLPTSPPPILFNIRSPHLLQPTNVPIPEAQIRHYQNTQYTTRKMPCPLGIEQDSLRLSKFLCYIRSECIEIFHATREDVIERMTSKKVQLGQVGIRCRFCAHLVPAAYRANRSSSFPTKIEGIYQAVQMMTYKHFPICEEIPANVRETYNSLKKLTKKGDIESRSYWIESARMRGMINSGKAGIRM